MTSSIIDTSESSSGDPMSVDGGSPPKKGKQRAESPEAGPSAPSHAAEAVRPVSFEGVTGEDWVTFLEGKYSELKETQKILEETLERLYDARNSLQTARRNELALETRNETGMRRLRRFREKLDRMVTLDPVARELLTMEVNEALDIFSGMDLGDSSLNLLAGGLHQLHSTVTESLPSTSTRKAFSENIRSFVPSTPVVPGSWKPPTTLLDLRLKEPVHSQSGGRSVVTQVPFSSRIPRSTSKVDLRTYFEHSMVKIEDEVRNRIMIAFNQLKANQPNHPIFGAPEKNQIRLPLSGSGNTWTKKAGQIAKSVADSMGTTDVPRSACWMTQIKEVIISSGTGVGQKRLTGFRAYRLLAFLANPTPENWQTLNYRGARDDEETGRVKQPFLHFCHNGYLPTRKYYCINGFDHGRFGTGAENDAQKKCSNASRVHCPGHGKTGPIFCIFVHKQDRDQKNWYTGWRKPCLDRKEGPPAICPHAPSCIEGPS